MRIERISRKILILWRDL